MFLGMIKWHAVSGICDEGKEVATANRIVRCLQAFAALLTAAVKCGEVELAIDVYRQMGQEGIACDRPLYQLMVDVFVKMGRHADALGVLDDMKRTGQPAEVQLYNLIVLSCTKTNNPRVALDVYKRYSLTASK